jgi:hypothetical protein
MKYIAGLIAILFFALVVSGQSRFPLDSVSHEVVFSQKIKLNSKIKTEDVYASALKWFGNPATFTKKNADPPIDTLKAKKNKRKAEAESQFDNPRPLQMQDPAGSKLVGMGISRYYGGMGTSIKLLYLKYDIYVEIKEGIATISALNIHYFHYNSQTYAQTGLYNFSGGKPCEEVGKIEALIGCENFHDEFKALGIYFNKETTVLFADFKNLMAQKKFLYDPKTASAAPKTTGKSTAKSATKAPAKKM